MEIRRDAEIAVIGAGTMGLGIAKDAAKSRAKQEAMLSKILAKVSKPSKQTKKAKR